MSEPTQGTAGTVVSGETVTIDPATNAAATPAPASKAKGDGAENISMPKDAFNARLERERNAWMKDLGVTDIEAVKAAIATSKAAEEAKKSDAERAATAKADLERVQADLAAAKSTLAETAKSALEGLTDEQKADIVELAGDDPAKQIKAANVLKKQWAASAATTVTATTPAVQSTMPTQGAPKDNGNTGSAPDPQAIFVELMKVNPYAGAQYGEAHGLFKRA